MTEPEPADVAEWLWEQLQEKRYLDRGVAIDGVIKRFGDEYIDETDNGTARIKPGVQSKFRRLYGDKAYYEGRGEDGGWIMNQPRQPEVQ